MAVRLPVRRLQPDSYQALSTLHEEVTQAAAKAGLEPLLMELVKIRSSQLNGCESCLEAHSRDALRLGEHQARIDVLPQWREDADLFAARERAALAVTESLTQISHHALSLAHAEAATVFTEQELSALVLGITVINAWNRIGVATSV